MSPYTFALDFETIDQISEQKRKLALRETEIKRRYRNLEIVNGYLGFIEQSRDHTLLGSKGLKTQALGWTNKVSEWLASWNQIVEIAAGLNQETIIQSTKRLNEALRFLYETFHKLQEEADIILDKARDRRIALEDRKDLPPSLVAGKEQDIAKINAQKANLIAAFRSFENNFDKKTTGQLHKAILEIKNGIELKLKDLLVQYPHLRTVVCDAENLLILIDEILPRTSKLKGMGRDLASYLNRDTIFAAQGIYKQMEDLSRSLTATIDVSQISDPLKDVEKTRINTIMNEAKIQLDESLAHMSKHAMFARFADRQRKIMSRWCRREEYQAYYDCELLRELNALDLSYRTIRGYKDDDLATIESMLLMVDQGTRYSRGGVR